MRTNLSTLACNILDANVKDSIDYLFEITLSDSSTIYYMSTKKKTYEGITYSDDGDPFITDFPGVTLRSNIGFAGLILPSSIIFNISNSDASLIPDDFLEASVIIRCIMSADISSKSDPSITIEGMIDEDENIVETEIMSWGFIVKNTCQLWGKLNISAIDWFYKYLEKDYPVTPLISSLWPTAHVPSDNYCIPRIFGECYFPVRWDKANATTDDFYVLGEYGGSSVTHTIIKLRDPNRVQTEYLESNSNCTFTIIEDKLADDGNYYSVVKLEIMPGMGNAIWNATEHQDVPLQYSRSDTVDITNPIQIIKIILMDLGVPEAQINNESYQVAFDICAVRGIEFSAPFYFKEKAEDVLNRLLIMANCRLFVREQLYFKINSTEADHTLNSSWVISSQENSPGEFMIQNLTRMTEDSGYILFRPPDLPISETIKFLIPVGLTTDNIIDEQIDCRYIIDSIHAQKIGIIMLQRKLFQSANISATLKLKAMQLEVGDTLAIEGENYGAINGNYKAVITEVRINSNNSISISAIKFSTALSDWDDISPSAITVYEDQEISGYQSLISGPTAINDDGYSPNDVYGPLRFLDGADLEFETSAILNVDSVIYTFTNYGLMIQVDHALDIGSATNAFHDIYAYNFNDVGDYFFLDNRLEAGKVKKIDDLAIINNMKSSKEYDKRTGLRLIDDNSLPEFLYVKDKKTGLVLRNKDGKPYFNTKSLISLIFGAIRQISRRLKAIEKTIKNHNQ